MELEEKHTFAPPVNGNAWLNSDPILLREVLDHVVMLEFWDSTDLCSLRAIPYVKDWYRKYAETGMVVVGVHTPHYAFAEDGRSVCDTLRRVSIEYPVVLDNDARIRSAYGDWRPPRRCLIDQDGYLRYVQYGADGYIEFERAMQQLLVEAYRGFELPPLTILPIKGNDAEALQRTGNRLEMGYLHGSLGNPEGSSPESTIQYARPQFFIPARFYASGLWMNGRECFRFHGDAGERGTIFLSVQGEEIYAVMGTTDGMPSEIIIEVDGHPLAPENLGSDCRQTSGHTCISVDIPRMYHVTQKLPPGEHLLSFATSSTTVQIFAVTW